MREERSNDGDDHAGVYPAEYLDGIRLFNSRRFYEAHDVWESLWLREPDARRKLLLQALIQSAVTFYHLEGGRERSARKMYERAKEKFARLKEKRLMSLDVESFERQFDSALSALLVGNERKAASVGQPASCSPRIVLLPQEKDLEKDF